MKKTNSIHPPKSKHRDKRGRPEDQRESQHVERRKPGSAQDSDSSDPFSKKEGPSSPGEADGTWRKPITNQDEQEKITNEGSGDTVIPHK